MNTSNRPKLERHACHEELCPGLLPICKPAYPTLRSGLPLPFAALALPAVCAVLLCSVLVPRTAGLHVFFMCFAHHARGGENQKPES